MKQLEPIEAAIQKLGLPNLRFRKLKGILSALAVQIEDGGDSPEVNRLLLNALRAGIHHQVASRAIDAFEQAEARRWEQVKAGAPPPIKVSPEDQIGDLVQEGEKLLRARKTADACDRWLEAWEIVKRLARPEMRTAEAFDDAYRGAECLFNWSSDLEMELGNAGLDNPIYHEHRLRYAREFLAQFPDEDANNMIRAQGEALWTLDRRAEAEAVYSALVERLPDEGWGYIGWADQHWLFDSSPKEYDKAEAILRRALARPSLQDRSDVLDRLRELQERQGIAEEQTAAAFSQPEQAAEPFRVGTSTTEEQATAASEPKQPQAESGPGQSATQSTLARPSLPGSAVPTAPPPKRSPPAKKPGRNEPCWCGSGRKYKRCHLNSDIR